MRKIILAITLLVPFSSYACKEHIPLDFQYKKKPIEPWCINQLSSNTPIVDLGECSDSFRFINIGKNNHIDKDKKYYFGYSYEPKTAHTAYPSYIFYKYLGKVGHSHVIHKEWREGSSGSYSYIYFIERDGDKLKLTDSRGGDRCIGGITDAGIDHGEVTYTINVTPLGFIDLANPKFLNADVSENLQDCAVCCYGKAVFRKGQLALIQLNSELALENTGVSKRMPLQDCFDKLYVRYLKENKTQLSMKELNQFADDFNKQCIIEAKSKRVANPALKIPYKENIWIAD